MPLLEDGTDEDISNHHLSHSTLKEMRGKEKGLSKMKLLGTKENGTNRSTFNPNSQLFSRHSRLLAFAFYKSKHNSFVLIAAITSPEGTPYTPDMITLLLLRVRNLCRLYLRNPTTNANESGRFAG